MAKLARSMPVNTQQLVVRGCSVLGFARVPLDMHCLAHVLTYTFGVHHLGRKR